jgi:hypothetical protein
MRLLLDPNKAGQWVLLCLLAIVALLILLFVDNVRAEKPADQSNDIDVFAASTEDHADKMIRHWIRLAPRHPLARPKLRAQYTRLMVAATELNNTPLALAMAIMFRESSGDPNVKPGKRGELGEMQVHPMTANRFRCQMKTRFGRFMCGNKVLKYWYDRCGTWRGAFTGYAGKYGQCQAKRGSNLSAVVRDRFNLAAELEAVAR